MVKRIKIITIQQLKDIVTKYRKYIKVSQPPIVGYSRIINIPNIAVGKEKALQFIEDNLYSFIELKRTGLKLYLSLSNTEHINYMFFNTLLRHKIEDIPIGRYRSSIELINATKVQIAIYNRVCEDLHFAKILKEK